MNSDRNFKTDRNQEQTGIREPNLPSHFLDAGARPRSMRVLVTGSRGLIGESVVGLLSAAGHTVVEYDLRNSQDILDPATLLKAIRNCNAVVHAAALLGRPGEGSEDIMAVNVLGTWNVLAACSEVRVQRLVFLSSVDALGIFKGERSPDYLPLDNDHPCYPATPYAISKYLAEEMCRLASESYGFPVVCLRPPGVWTEDTYAMIEAERSKRPEFEWHPYWEYGAFIDVRDLACACLNALTCDTKGFSRILVSSADITTSGKASRELAQTLCPGADWRGDAGYEEDPYRTLMDLDPARELLGWSPKHTWRRFIDDRE